MLPEDNEMSRPIALSIVVGIASAVVIGLVGPLWGGLVVVLGLPVVFLTISRLLFGTETRRVWSALLVAAGLTWLALLPVAPFPTNALAAEPATVGWLVAIGAVPVLVGFAVVVAGATAFGTRDIRRR